ncbi:ParA family protein [Silvibacterium sp.]|uniref:ParA family protein n=1 Tax=Silvibacterium sp. TaxID=1964179 RepID=UPI0039E3F0C1
MMFGLTVSNQRGGVSKTTSSVILADIFAKRGKRVLLVDADPQGSIAALLGLKPTAFLHDLLIRRVAFRECLTSPRANLDIICGNRFTTEAETITMNLPFREFVFKHTLGEYEKNYDVILIDVAPSISLFQTCAMVYTQRVLIPVDMDILSVQGATASIQAGDMLNGMLSSGVNVRVAGLLPVKVDRRLAITDVVLNTLTDISKKRKVPLFPSIRTDQSIVKAARHKQFVADYDPRSKAYEDYEAVADRLQEQFTPAEVVRIDEKTAS